MKKDNWLYLVGGILLGALVAYGIYDLAGRRAPGAAHDSGPSGSAVSGQPMPAGVPPQATVPPEEIANLERVIQADPKNHTALARLGNLMYDSARWTEALGYYRRALDAGPQDPNVLTDAGICCRQLRRFDEALEYFRRAHGQEPTHWQSLFNTVVVAGFDLGRFEVADEALSELEKINPQTPGLEKLRQDLALAKAGRGKTS